MKTESLKEDLSKIEFVTNTYIWKSGRIDEFLEKNKFLKKRPYTFDEIYTTRGANKIFHYFKRQFYFLDYSPFSFTKEILDDNQKKHFIHNIIH
jgi:hypothetical protein